MKSFSTILALGSLVMLAMMTAAPTSAVQATPILLSVKRGVAYSSLAGGSVCTGAGCAAKGSGGGGRGCEAGDQCRSPAAASQVPSPSARRSMAMSGADLEERLNLARRAAINAWLDSDLDTALVSRMLAMGQ